MYLTRLSFGILSCLLTFTLASVRAQTPETKPTPSPSPNIKPDDQERIKIFTQEVILPIVAYDAFGRFDPTLSPDDVLVMEDGIWQHVRSARRIPLNVVLLIDMGSVMVFTQHLDVTRKIASRVLSKLRPGDRVALIQFTNRAEVLQDWTEDKERVVKALDRERGKLLSGKRSRLAEGLKLTAERLKDREAGSTHVVLITDGDDGVGTEFSAAMDQLVNQQPALHVLSYTTVARQETRKRKGGLFFDREMKRFYQEFDDSIKSSEKRLAALVENLGGRIFLPSSLDEALKQGDELAGEIGATCVLTYSPKRQIESSETSKSRHIQVFPRRTGLRVRALRTTVNQ